MDSRTNPIKKTGGLIMASSRAEILRHVKSGNVGNTKTPAESSVLLQQPRPVHDVLAESSSAALIFSKDYDCIF